MFSYAISRFFAIESVALNYAMMKAAMMPSM